MFDVKASLEFIKSRKEYLENCFKLYDIYNRNIVKHLDDRLFYDLKSEASRKEVRSRLSPINILPKIVNKLSAVYSVKVFRRLEHAQPLVDGIVSEFKFNEALELANKMLNLHRCVAIEPIVNSGRLRVIPAHKFLVMSDDTIDNNIIEFIKIIGEKNTATGTVFIYESYTVDEFVTYDGNGNILTRIPNEFGFIPVAYITRDVVTVMPDKDDETLAMVTLLPLLLSDLNYALKFQCFSIIYTINAAAKNMTLAPNAVWPFKTDGSDTDKPEIGQIKPSVAVNDLLSALMAQYSLWLESRSIKINSFSTQSQDNLSGIAKAIDQADVMEDVRYQRTLFISLETNLMRIITSMRGLDVEPTVTFEDSTLIPETPSEKIDRLIKKLDAKLISWELAVREANTHLSALEIAAMMQTIKTETEAQEEAQERSRAAGVESKTSETKASSSMETSNVRTRDDISDRYEEAVS